LSYTNQAIASTTCAYAVIACTTNNGVITITCANVIISCRASNLKPLDVREINCIVTRAIVGLIITVKSPCAIAGCRTRYAGT